MKDVIMYALFFAVIVLLSVILVMSRHIRKLEEKNTALSVSIRSYNFNRDDFLKKQLNLTILQNQINPHFLYNTLEAIRSQAVISDHEDIALAAEKLGNYFRYCINSNGDPVRLFEELQNIQDYFHIIQLRFLDRINLKIQIEDKSILQTYLPRMTLQPLVENAINHGLKDKIRGAEVVISANQSDSVVYLKVSDNGCGMSDSQISELEDRLDHTIDYLLEKDRRHGIALLNVHHRIQLMFGENYGLHIESIYGLGTDICIEYRPDYNFGPPEALSPENA